MKPVVSKGIVLNRTNYGEADRILVFLTPDQGKVHAIAKGVRKSKSKLAGGIELFTVADISFIRGKSELVTMTSARLNKHFGEITKQLDRANAGYEVLKIVAKHTDDHPDASYFGLVSETFDLLNRSEITPNLSLSWFYTQLLKLDGRTPNLQTDFQNKALNEQDKFLFDYQSMALKPHNSGPFNASHIKLLRALLSSAKVAARLEVSPSEIDTDLQLLRSLHTYRS